MSSSVLVTMIKVATIIDISFFLPNFIIVFEKNEVNCNNI